MAIMQDREVVLVQAGNIFEFRRWCQFRNVPRERAMYFDDRQKLAGLDASKVVLIRTGTWWHGMDVEEQRFPGITVIYDPC